MKNLNTILSSLLIGASAAIFAPTGLEACTRALFVGSDNVVITGRSMDWMEDMKSDIWLFPRAIERNGSAGENSITWTSQYGSVIVSGYNVGTADGINEKGLVANVLYLVESNYGKPTNEKPLLSISLWAQYVLDNFATVKEAVQALGQEPFRIVAPILPNGSPAQLHLSISDKDGDSAILEYLDGKLVIHHGKEYQVMTNSPTFAKQLAINEYWKEIGDLNFLPGTHRAADRFARTFASIQNIPKKSASQYIDAVPEQTFVNQAIASMMGVIRSVSVPLGISTPEEPNIASTLWRTVADHKNKIYFFDSATSPNTFWVDLKKLNFEKDAPVQCLITSKGMYYSGEVSSRFEVSVPFTFLPAKP